MTDASMHARLADYKPGVFADKLAGTEPPTLAALAERVLATAYAFDESGDAQGDGTAAWEAVKAFRAAFYRLIGIDPIIWAAVQRETGL